jgi:hypothetical protein
MDVCVFIILREIQEKKESSNASVRGLTTAQSYHITTPQTQLMPQMPLSPGGVTILDHGTGGLAWHLRGVAICRAQPW